METTIGGYVMYQDYFCPNAELLVQEEIKNLEWFLYEPEQGLYWLVDHGLILV